MGRARSSKQHVTREEAGPNPAGQAARAAALSLLIEVLDRARPLDGALTGAPASAGLEARDRAFARLIATTVLRRLGQIDALIDHCLSHPLPKEAGPVRQVLRLAVAQLAFLGTAPHAAVETAVGLAPERFKGLVNAVLRRLVREAPSLIAEQHAAALNTPKWLWDSWCASYGERTAEAMALQHQAEPPLDLIVKAAAREWAERLGGRILPTGGIRLTGGGLVTQLAGYEEGAWWVQDAAASLPARLLGQVAGKRVADLCAAPGGKTAQLALAGAAVTAVDRSPQRLERVAENLKRLGLEATLIRADASQWTPPAKLDAVLLDAPCSATGTIRRHPDLTWLKRPEDLASLTALQDRLLDAASGFLKPGGILLYSVCSLQPEEGPSRIARLLSGGRRLERVPIEAGEVDGQSQFLTQAGELRTLPCHWPDLGGIDGFYAARLRFIG
ncbi:MAG: methyltransferase domain-containing protein [Proteobacteria bacterium]|nr:methyltransferase domain-containing protein [Pseudomonadota bacterium]MBI3497665.1 methyltransferase domain-containing protein [Pseudomonadota bacterium]